MEPGATRVESAVEASGFLVVPLVFKTRERRAAPLAGSIPVRLRHTCKPDTSTLPAKTRRLGRSAAPLLQ